MEEAGYSVRSERLLRNTHLPTRPTDQRRMDLVAAPGPRSVGAQHGVPLFADITVVSVHTCSGQARPASATIDGAAIGRAVTAKRRKYADVHASAQASLLVLGCEVYGRWSDDASRLINELAALKARQSPDALRGCARYAWANRWYALVGVGMQRAIGEALLREGGVDLQASPPTTEAPPLADVLLGA